MEIITQNLHRPPTEEPAPLPPTPLVVIEAAGGWDALNLAEAWHFRDLVLSLAGRDVRLRYRQTFLGAAWVVFQPLMAAGIFAFVFGKVGRFSSNGIPYFLFSYAGLLAWNVFSTTLTKCSACLIGNSQLISKVYFPRIVLPLSTVPSVLIDFVVALAVLAVLMPAFRAVPGPEVLLLPLWLLLILLFALGLGLIASALTVNYRDVQYILPVLTQFMLYASPVAYAVGQVPQKYRTIYLLNPLSTLLEAFRRSLLGGAAGELHWGQLAFSAFTCVGTFVVGLWSFKRMEHKFADVI